MTHGSAPTALESVLPDARLIEQGSVELALPVERAWEVVRHIDLADSPVAVVLFTMRTLPTRLRGRRPERESMRLDDLISSPERPGFQVLVDSPPREVVVGAIGRVWRLGIPFVHVGSPEAVAAYGEPGFVKVAWALRLEALSAGVTKVTVDVRVGATDE